MAMLRIPGDPDAEIAKLRNARGVASIEVKGVRLGSDEPAKEEKAEVKKLKRARKKDLHETRFVAPNAWIVGIETFSEANLAGVSRASIGRKANQRKAVQDAMAANWQVWGPIADAARSGKLLTIKLATLGCRTRDRWDNLPRSLKAVLDGCCLQLGIDDGMKNLKVEYDQLESDKIGVRIMLEVGE